ncbi:hypothetical protein FRX31_016417 [Thalictrum thalictroides]|uniref:Uncharacterized protein n=1 Tax=Thalictrum thalictroides TaxID=46969 RepID=A0A7J6W973_THATH|nr:hypothetical protein FRX31_016417 [Thalictrum thalictroides]
MSLQDGYKQATAGVVGDDVVSQKKSKEGRLIVEGQKKLIVEGLPAAGSMDLQDRSALEMMGSEDGDNVPSASSATIATTNSNGINGKYIDDDDEKNNNNNESLPLPIPKPLESTTTIVTATTTKGKGLKKWRRIQRRDFAKEEEAESGSSSSIDPNRILKRDLRSDNSEDPISNKSSTAATIIAPIKFRSHRSTSSNRGAASSSSVKNTNNNAYSSSSQRPSRIESTKKLRGSARIDKDASYSSVESDLRSSAATANVFFTENISNGKHISYDVDNSSEAQASDQQSNDYVQTNYFKDNGEEEVSQDDDDDAGEASWEAKEEQSESQRQSTSQDLLAESIVSLQAVHDALEKGDILMHLLPF